MSEKTIALDNFTFNFNFKHLLFVVLLLVGLYFLNEYIAIKQAVNNVPTYNYEEVAAIAEEIYDAESLAEAIRDLPIEKALLDKMTKEILLKLAKNIDYRGCEVYFLEVQQAGMYPVLGYANKIIGYTPLKVGDVWKVGFTGVGEKNRYSSSIYYKNAEEGILLNKDLLLYRTMYEGTYKEMIVLEKLLIYSYSVWSGYPNLIKPPGCKIFR